MSKKIQKYDGYSKSILGHPVRAIASYADQTRTFVGTTYYSANIKGRFRQIEADMILEHELGLSPRRKKKNQSW